ncbi:hypothetical protein [Jejuia pallidilutea]|uniref:Lipoprotein n=1 Tax=Jejuia pallidilutea TaxID=504487 RepID=A0A090WAT0_9FLAO|nr:hypothetical protein [Jejuia pallidilutea]GAL73318.1 hypothetical protein JCM19302_2566 [Jejuia pallidilutea]GAL89667.1 hypothetical protein JCM19538_1229 [Jejuia pallidilutea]
MRQTFSILIILLTFQMSFACSCGKYRTFISASKDSELIIKAKVLKHNYYNRKRQSVSKEKINETEFFGHSILVEVLEIIKGQESRKTFEIYGGSEWKYASDCKMKIDGMKIDKTYIFSLYKSIESKHSQPNENKDDYSLYACQESYIEYNDQTESVKGVLKGKNLDKKRIMPYEKLKDKITFYNNGYNSLRLNSLSEFNAYLLSFGYGGKNPADFSATKS